MTKHTDEQLQAAMLQAGKYDSVSIAVDDSMCSVADYEIEDLRRILDHLPDWRAGDAEVIEFEDIRVGDRILIKTVNGCFYEVTVKGIREDDAIWWAGSSVAQNMIARTYLMHRTVQHPDPEVCKDIIVYKTTRQKYGEQNPRYPSFHYSWADDLWRGDISTVLQTSEILEWSPAKVIADE